MTAAHHQRRRVHTVPEAARELRVSEWTVKRLIRDGELYARRTATGGRVLIPDFAIDDFLRGKAVRPTRGGIA